MFDFVAKTYYTLVIGHFAGADPGFQARGGGGGGAFKKIAPSGLPPLGAILLSARKILGYFVWKITILRQKIIFFPILGGGGRGRRVRPPPPGSAPALCYIGIYGLL